MEEFSYGSLKYALRNMVEQANKGKENKIKDTFSTTEREVIQKYSKLMVDKMKKAARDGDSSTTVFSWDLFEDKFDGYEVAKELAKILKVYYAIESDVYYGGGEGILKARW